jgi:hypothetical protein
LAQEISFGGPGALGRGKFLSKIIAPLKNEYFGFSIMDLALWSPPFSPALNFRHREIIYKKISMTAWELMIALRWFDLEC